MTLRRIAAAAVTAVGLALLPTTAHAATAVIDVPITFNVVNRNTTGVPCAQEPDGKTYPVHGTIVMPKTAKSVTLYLHGLGYGGWFFRFGDVPGYDYARQQAAAGHASVVVDRLGNPNQDDLKDGLATCLSAQADMADQMVTALRAGQYTAAGVHQKFGRVLLAGHSLGGMITELTQSVYSSADAIAVIGYTDYPSPLAFSTFFAAGGDCLVNPRQSHGSSGAPNYAAYGRSDADFAAGHFHDVDPSVAARVLYKRNLDPCGDLLNAAQALAHNHLGTLAIDVPVLLISGADDALFPPPTDKLQTLSFPSAPQVSQVELPDTGHAVTLGVTHEQFRSQMSRWLTEHGA